MAPKLWQSVSAPEHVRSHIKQAFVIIITYSWPCFVIASARSILVPPSHCTDFFPKPCPRALSHAVLQGFVQPAAPIASVYSSVEHLETLFYRPRDIHQAHASRFYLWRSFSKTYVWVMDSCVVFYFQ